MAPDDARDEVDEGLGDELGDDPSTDDDLDEDRDEDAPLGAGVARVEVGDDEISYDFAPWAGESRELLGSLLTSEGIRHAWQGTTLVVPVEVEGDVDRLIEDVQAVAAGSLDPSRERVVYEVGNWSAALQTSLVESLTVADIPYEWDEGGDLVVYADDEDAVERIFDGMPDPDDPDAADLDGVDVNQAIFDLWESAGVLAKRPADADAVVTFVDTTSLVERVSVPFGFEPANWRDLCADAGAIRDALEATDDEAVGDDELRASAAALHQRLRPFV